MNSGWDTQLLTLELKGLDDEGFDLEMLGFDADELSELMSDVNFDPATENEQGKLDELDPKWIICPKCGSEFDARKN
jgi:hypothetical protein